jgi:hypothetical protein
MVMLLVYMDGVEAESCVSSMRLVDRLGRRGSHMTHLILDNTDTVCDSERGTSYYWYCTCTSDSVLKESEIYLI